MSADIDEMDMMRNEVREFYAHISLSRYYDKAGIDTVLNLFDYQLAYWRQFYSSHNLKGTYEQIDRAVAKICKDLREPSYEQTASWGIIALMAASARSDTQAQDMPSRYDIQRVQYMHDRSRWAITHNVAGQRPQGDTALPPAAQAAERLDKLYASYRMFITDASMQALQEIADDGFGSVDSARAYMYSRVRGRNPDEHLCARILSEASQRAGRRLAAGSITQEQ